jgi:hypothetical protein
MTNKKNSNDKKAATARTGNDKKEARQEEATVKAAKVSDNGNRPTERCGCVWSSKIELVFVQPATKNRRAPCVA